MCKKIIYGAVTVLLLLSLFFTTSLTQHTAATPTKTLDKDALRYLEMPISVTCACDTAGITHVADGQAAQILLSLQDVDCTLLALSYDGTLPADFSAKLFVAENGTFHENKFATPLSIGTANVLYFVIEQNDSASPELLLSFSERIAVTGASTYAPTGEAVTRAFNPVPFAVFLGGLLLLLALEKKLGYYGFFAGLIKNEITYTKGLTSAKKKRLAALHIAAIGSTAALFLLVAVCLTLTVYTKPTLLLIFILAFLAVVLQLADRLVSGRGDEIAKLFLVIALLAGIMLSTVAPPTTHTSWDDEIHLRKVFTVSGLASDDPSLAKLKLFALGYRVRDYLDDPAAFVRVLEEDNSVGADYTFEFGNPYITISYIPAIIAAGAAHLFGGDLATTLTLCRMANLLAFALIVYMGLKKLRGGALIFSSVALMPAVLFLGCSIGYDFWLTAWLIYAFAHLFSILQDPEGRIMPADMVKILLAFFIGCSAKALYCVLMLPLLFIGKARFAAPRHQRNLRIATVLIMLAIFAILLVPGITVFDLYTDVRGGASVSAADQIKYILTHPFAYAGVLFRHLTSHLSMQGFNEYSAVFGFLDGYGASYDLLYGTISILVVLFCLITDNKSDITKNGTRYLRLFIGLACLLQMAVVSTSMYIGFNPIGATSISGCQFRYVFPCLPPLFYCIAPRRMRVSVSEEWRRGIVFGALALNIFIGFCCTYLYKFWM